MRTGIFVQVRLGSTRLGRKALLPLADGTIIGHVMRALSLVDADVRALLTDPDSLDALASEAAAHGFLAVAGHPARRARPLRRCRAPARRAAGDPGHRRQPAHLSAPGEGHPRAARGASG